MPLAQVLYRTLLRGLRVVSPAMTWGSSKLSRGIRGRRGAHRVLGGWGTAARDPARPVIWLHASSVGEALQAEAVLGALRVRMPDLQAVFTFFSPSAEGLAARFPADVSAYLPWDLPEVTGRVLDTVCPAMVVFTQKEVWPSLTSGATDRGIPVVLVAATLPGRAGRLSRSGRALLGPTFRRLERVAAISKNDGDRFQLLGVPPDRIAVTGDPGVDYASGRAAAANLDAPYLKLFRDGSGSVLVAGSTWRSDEDVLIPALARLRLRWPGLRVVLAPHEPDGWDFEGLRARLTEDGWSPTLLREAEGRGSLDGADAVLVERFGVLAELYTVASIAYVGGGFHDHGLHSVLEPAAAGAPVLFGPRYHDSLAAVHLADCGGGRTVSDVDALAAAVEAWLADPEKLERDGGRALGYIAEHRGAAGRTADLLVDRLSDSA